LKSRKKTNQIPSLGAAVVVVVVSSSFSCSGVVVVDDSSSIFVSLLTGTFGFVVVVVFGFGTNR